MRLKRRYLSAPHWFWSMKAFFWEFMPTPIITRDQIKLLKHDNVVDVHALSFADLGIAPKSMKAVVPSYMERHRSQKANRAIESA